MKRTIIKIIAVGFLVLASTATAVLADGGPAPLCIPGKPCPGGR